MIERPNARTTLQNNVVMSGLLWGLASALIALLMLVSAILATPVKFAFEMRTLPQWRLKIVVRLLGGLTPEISIHDSERQQQQGTAPKAKKKTTTRSRRMLRRIPRAVAATPQLLAGLLRPVHLERLAIDADIGLADPADTGQLFGMLAAANHGFPQPPRMSIVVRPDFSGPRASGELDAALSFIPLLLVPPGLRFAWRVFGPRR